jgi:carbonic anhydrase/acetyltransferase-like protein (isoleucine patch superfamily)
MDHVYTIDGLRPVIAPGAFVHPAAVLIGDVTVGPGCYVGSGRQPARRLRPADPGGRQQHPG